MSHKSVLGSRIFVVAVVAHLIFACGSEQDAKSPTIDPTLSQPMREYMACVATMRSYMRYSYIGGTISGTAPTGGGAGSCQKGATQDDKPLPEAVLTAIEKTCREIALKQSTPLDHDAGVSHVDDAGGIVLSDDAGAEKDGGIVAVSNLPPPVVVDPPRKDPPPPVPSDPCLGAMRDCGGFDACMRITNGNGSACNGMKNFSQSHGCWRGSSGC